MTHVIGAGGAGGTPALQPARRRRYTRFPGGWSAGGFFVEGREGAFGAWRPASHAANRADIELELGDGARERVPVHAQLARGAALVAAVLLEHGEQKALFEFADGFRIEDAGLVHLLNERFELVDLREKPKPGEPTSPWYNAGIYAFRPSIFEFIARLERSPRGEFELTDAIRNLAHSGKKVQALELIGAWADVRDPEILAALNQKRA